MLSIVKVALSTSLLLGWLLLGSGCSYAFVHGPTQTDLLAHSRPQENPSSTPTCTTSNAAPIIDTILGVSLVGLGGTAVVGAAASSHGSASAAGVQAHGGRSAGLYCTGCSVAPSDTSSLEAAGIALTAGVIAVGTLFVASAVTGYGRTTDCRAAVEALPAGPHPSARYLRELNALAEVRAREERKQGESF
jgi:hypothetical protein